MQALMKQLGALPGGVEFMMDDDNDRPGGSAGAIIINPSDMGDGLGGGGVWGLTDDDITATTSPYMSRTLTPPHGHTYSFETLSGALAALLAPPPALLLPHPAHAARQQSLAQSQPQQAQQSHMSLQLQLQHQLQQQMHGASGAGLSNTQLMLLSARDAAGSHGQVPLQHQNQQHQHQHSPFVLPMKQQATSHAAAGTASTAHSDIPGAEPTAHLSSAARDCLLQPSSAAGGSGGGGMLAVAADVIATQFAKRSGTGGSLSTYSRAPSAAMGGAATMSGAAGAAVMPLAPSLLSGGAGFGTPAASGRMARVVVMSACAAAAAGAPGTPLSMCMDAADPTMEAAAGALHTGTGLSSAATAQFDCLPTGGLTALMNSPSEAALATGTGSPVHHHHQPQHQQSQLQSQPQQPLAPSAPPSQVRPRSSLKAAVLALGAAVVGSGRRTAAGDVASSLAAGSTAPAAAPAQLPQPLSPVAASGPLLPVSPTQTHMHTHSTCGTGSCVGGGAPVLPPAAHVMVALPPPPPPVIEEVERLLAHADGWQFNTWRLAEATGGHALSALGFFLLQREGLIDKFKIKRTRLARWAASQTAAYVPG